MFQDGSDRVPTDSPPTPRTTPHRPTDARARSASTVSSPRKSDARARPAARRRTAITVFLGPRTGRRSRACMHRRRNVVHLARALVAARKPVVALRTSKVRPPPSDRRPGAPERDVPETPAPGRRTESDARTMRSSPFASGRFHVLLNSLFKVLFNFPSRYLFAIGLVPVFSLRWSLPPALGCNLKQPDSKNGSACAVRTPYGPGTLSGRGRVQANLGVRSTHLDRP